MTVIFTINMDTYIESPSTSQSAQLIYLRCRGYIFNLNHKATIRPTQGLQSKVTENSVFVYL
jgi:hypothetical protein